MNDKIVLSRGVFYGGGLRLEGRDVILQDEPPPEPP
jgi:hypothetical protein